jgi:predicted negative regulator of RcsB-dependent stress response
VTKKLETFILVLLLTVTTANAKRQAIDNGWTNFYSEALADLEKRRFEEAKRNLVSAEHCYDEDYYLPLERIDTTFAKAVVDFYLKDYKSCETRLVQVSNLESTFTNQPEHPLSNPLELLGDLCRAEGKDQAAREHYKSALEAKKYQKFYSPLQEQRLLHKLSDIKSEQDAYPDEYTKEYATGVRASKPPNYLDPKLD